MPLNSFSAHWEQRPDSFPWPKICALPCHLLPCFTTGMLSSLLWLSGQAHSASTFCLQTLDACRVWFCCFLSLVCFSLCTCMAHPVTRLASSSPTKPGLLVLEEEEEEEKEDVLKNSNPVFLIIFLTFYVLFLCLLTYQLPSSRLRIPWQWRLSLFYSQITLKG